MGSQPPLQLEVYERCVDIEPNCLTDGHLLSCDRGCKTIEYMCDDDNAILEDDEVCQQMQQRRNLSRDPL
jgi:hypothetical protein